MNGDPKRGLGSLSFCDHSIFSPDDNDQIPYTSALVHSLSIGDTLRNAADCLAAWEHDFHVDVAEGNASAERGELYLFSEVWEEQLSCSDPPAAEMPADAPI